MEALQIRSLPVVEQPAELPPDCCQTLPSSLAPPSQLPALLEDSHPEPPPEPDAAVHPPLPLFPPPRSAPTPDSPGSPQTPDSGPAALVPDSDLTQVNLYPKLPITKTLFQNTEKLHNKINFVKLLKNSHKFYRNLTSEEHIEIKNIIYDKQTIISQRKFALLYLLNIDIPVRPGTLDCSRVIMERSLSKLSISLPEQL